MFSVFVSTYRVWENLKAAFHILPNFHLYSLFQALSHWGRSKKRFLDEQDLVKKIGEGAETRACKNCFKNLIPVYQLPVYLLIGLF